MSSEKLYSSTIPRVTLCGSFQRDIEGLKRAYRELSTCGCQILSPHRIDFESSDDLFVKDPEERSASVRSIESHHLMAIRQSHFIWLHAPNAYVGPSGIFEIGYATALGIPIFCKNTITDIPVSFYIEKASSVFDALEQISS